MAVKVTSIGGNSTGVIPVEDSRLKSGLLRIQPGSLGYKLLIALWIATSILLIGITDVFGLRTASAVSIDDLSSLEQEYETGERNGVTWYVTDERYTDSDQRVCVEGIQCDDVSVVEVVLHNTSSTPAVIDVSDVGLITRGGKDHSAQTFDCGIESIRLLGDEFGQTIDCVSRTMRFAIQPGEQIAVAIVFELPATDDPGVVSSLRILEPHRQSDEPTLISLS